jgi:hypothetical protein
VIGTATACWGPVSYYLGLLAGALGDCGLAIDHFEAALQETTRIGAFAFRAWTQYEYGRILAKAPDAPTRLRSVELLVSARAFADQMGMTVLSNLVSRRC